MTRWGAQCAKNRKTPISIPNDFTGIFHWLDPSGPHCGPWVKSDCNRNEYHGYNLEGKDGRCLGMKPWPSSCADFLEILGASISLTPKGLSRPVKG